MCKNYLLLSPKMRFESDVLSKCIKFERDPKPDKVLGHWTITGSYNADIKSVPSLYKEVERFQLRLETKLKKYPDICTGFNEQIFKRIKNNNFSFYEDILKKHPEIASYQKVYSPVNYSLKSDSINTSVRPCVNMGFCPDPAFPSLNDCMFTGPSLNLPIQQITLKMRQYKEFGISDINNFYQSCHLSLRDKALNLMLFRENGWGKPGEIKTLLSNRLNYGSRHSQFLANKCKLLTSEEYILPISNNAHELLKSSMTDDVFVGHFNRDEMIKLSEIMTTGLLKANFVLKDWSFSRQCNKEVQLGPPGLNEESQGTLGLVWFPLEDVWKIKSNICLAPKRRGAKDPYFIITDMNKARELFEKYGVSRRAALRISHSFYDPNSLFIQLKTNKHLLYRKLIRICPDLPWDDLIPTSLHPEWLQVIKMTLECSNIKIPRFCMYGCADLTAELGLFADGSKECSSCRIFIRYKNSDNQYNSNYLTGSSKLAAPGSESAPHTECEAALMSLRLAATVKETLNDISITGYHLFSDSTITLGGITGNSCTQKLFYSLRNFSSAKLVDELKVKLWLCSSENQEADIGSKLDLNINHALTQRYWHGQWFHKSQEHWPVTAYEHRPSDIISIQNPKLTLNVFSMTFAASLIEKLLKRYNSFDKILSVLAYIFCFLKQIQTFSSGWGKALNFILKMLKLSQSEISGVSRLYLVEKDDNGLFIAMPRNYKLKGQTIYEKLWIISSHEQISQKILYDCHIHCSNVGAEISKMMEKGFLVLKAATYFRRLSRDCITCRRIRKACSASLMGPNHQLNVAQCTPNFAVCYMDVMGYFKLKERKNFTSKLWILVLTDLKSRFTKFVPLQNMKSESILMSIKQASYQLAGSIPFLIYSDSASNFIPISKLENGQIDTKEQNKLITNLRKVLHSQKITLKTNCPRASWRNSAAESMVKVFKLCLKKCGLDQKTFTLQQWIYVASKIEFLCNNRCLSIKYLDQTFVPLRPSDLVFGKRRGIFPRDFDLHDTESKLFSNLIILDKQLSDFENLYFNTYCIELKRWTKFKHKSKTLDIGDICWMLDRINKSTKHPTLCEVVSIHSERTYSVRYSKIEAKLNPVTYEIKKVSKFTTVLRPSQQLCYICSKDDRGEINTDIYTPTRDVLEEDLLPLHQVQENRLDDELVSDIPSISEPILHADSSPNTSPKDVFEEDSTNFPDISSTDLSRKVSNKDPLNSPGTSAVKDVSGGLNDHTIHHDISSKGVLEEDPDLTGLSDAHTEEIPDSSIGRSQKPKLKVQYDEDVSEIVDIVKPLSTTKEVKSPPKRKRGRPSKRK